jgi:hypothetical protein
VQPVGADHGLEERTGLAAAHHLGRDPGQGARRQIGERRIVRDVRQQEVGANVRRVADSVRRHADIVPSRAGAHATGEQQPEENGEGAEGHLPVHAL